MTYSTYQAVIQKIKWLSTLAYEVTFSRPDGFIFSPGQRIRFMTEHIQRDYTIISGTQDQSIKICIRLVEDGAFSTVLAKALPGDTYRFTGPHGYFRYAGIKNQAVFVATGTGIAPFVSFANNHVTGFILIHGVSGLPELYYKDILKPSAMFYTPCISSHKHKTEHSSQMNVFHGRVTQYIKEQLPSGVYDFYLCGNSEMITDVTVIIDERFPECKVFTESFT